MRHLRAALVMAAGLAFVVSLGALDARATFPGKNGQIAFFSNQTGNDEVFTMDPNGKDVRQLTDNPASDTFPNWSSDGTKVVFTSNRDGNREIYVMNADGSDQTRLTNHPAVDTRPDWSPDGSKIIFVSSRDGDREIYVMNADGTNVSPQLTNNTDLDNVPIFSPDGTKILFFRLLPETQHFAIFVMDADGTDEQQLTPDELKAAEGDWSPDGKRIIFQDNTCPLPECAVPSDIRVMNADGSNVKRLTHFFEAGGPDSAINPRWSPDGKKVVFIVTPDFTCGLDFPCVFDIYRMTDDGKALKNITDSPEANDGVGAWGPRVGKPGAEE